MIDSFLKYLQYEKRFSKHTLSAYERDLNQLHFYLKDIYEVNDLKEVTHPILRSWVVSLIDSGIAPQSVNRKLATLKSFYKFLQARHYVTQNPASRLKPLKTEKKLPSFVREGEMTILLDQLKFSEDFSGFRDKMILELLYATGIRLSELINLTDKQINFYQGSIKVLGKRNKERVIPIGDSFVRVIKEYLEIRNRDVGSAEGYLLVTDSGDQLYPMLVYRTVKKYLEQVTTLSKTSPHVLRHTFATHLLDKGADLNAVKDLLGHTSLAATQVYTHNSMEKLKSAFDQAHPRA
ncbi:tyrosine-type recombinase/integrase [Marinoscillum sp. MHG1-6]|uniref:tyrosine-type recombinase/integrase n=1 Tax=Marinoscillum sp. MHG1-6 TaxID=2959627 RepID=UPI002157E257|nr:tyrosine-type recombinase/integrase [Marinoscillum sp. MHG1-6]